MPVYVKGVGLTNVSEHWEKNFVELVVEASEKAIEDSGINPNKIDKIIVANAASPYLLKQSHLGPLVVDYLGLRGVPALTVEGGGASGAIALHVGFREILAGAENVLIVGVEKLSDNLSEEVVGAVSLAEDWEFMAGLGITYESLQGILLHLYLQRFNPPRENIAKLAELGHKHAVKSPHAMYPFPVSVDKILKSPPYADPLKLFEIAGRGDGAAAVILSNSNGHVEFLATEIATDKFRIYERNDLLELDAIFKAAQKALNYANISIKDIDVLELHDTSTIVGILELEALGLAERGKGHELLEKGELDLNGRIPTNTFGGSKARGDPIGATGVYQFAEVYKQLIGDAGFNQIDGVKIGLTVTIGGIASTAVVNILRRR